MAVVCSTIDLRITTMPGRKGRGGSKRDGWGGGGRAGGESVLMREEGLQPLTKVYLHNSRENIPVSSRVMPRPTGQVRSVSIASRVKSGGVGSGGVRNPTGRVGSGRVGPGHPENINQRTNV